MARYDRDGSMVDAWMDRMLAEPRTSVAIEREDIQLAKTRALNGDSARFGSPEEWRA